MGHSPHTLNCDTVCPNVDDNGSNWINEKTLSDTLSTFIDLTWPTKYLDFAFVLNNQAHMYLNFLSIDDNSNNFFSLLLFSIKKIPFRLLHKIFVSPVVTTFKTTFKSTLRSYLIKFMWRISASSQIGCHHFEFIMKRACVAGKRENVPPERLSYSVNLMVFQIYFQSKIWHYAIDAYIFESSLHPKW